MQKDITKQTHWGSFVNIILGAWVFSIPWVIGFGFEKYEINVIMWNFVLVGLVVVTTSIITIKKLTPWPEWLSFYTGVWLFCSPLFLVYWKNSILLWNSLLVGVLIAGFSALAIPAAERKNMYHRTFKRNLLMKNH